MADAPPPPRRAAAGPLDDIEADSQRKRELFPLLICHPSKYYGGDDILTSVLSQDPDLRKTTHGFYVKGRHETPLYILRPPVTASNTEDREGITRFLDQITRGEAGELPDNKDTHILSPYCVNEHWYTLDIQIIPGPPKESKVQCYDSLANGEGKYHKQGVFPSDEDLAKLLGNLEVSFGAVNVQFPQTHQFSRQEDRVSCGAIVARDILAILDGKEVSEDPISAEQGQDYRIEDFKRMERIRKEEGNELQENAQSFTDHLQKGTAEDLSSFYLQDMQAQANAIELLDQQQGAAAAAADRGELGDGGVGEHKASDDRRVPAPAQPEPAQQQPHRQPPAQPALGLQPVPQNPPQNPLEGFDDDRSDEGDRSPPGSRFRDIPLLPPMTGEPAAAITTEPLSPLRRLDTVTDETGLDPRDVAAPVYCEPEFEPESEEEKKQRENYYREFRNEQKTESVSMDGIPIPYGPLLAALIALGPLTFGLVFLFAPLQAAAMGSMFFGHMGENKKPVVIGNRERESADDIGKRQEDTTPIVAAFENALNHIGGTPLLNTFHKVQQDTVNLVIGSHQKGVLETPKSVEAGMTQLQGVLKEQKGILKKLSNPDTLRERLPIEKRSLVHENAEKRLEQVQSRLSAIDVLAKEREEEKDPGRREQLVMGKQRKMLEQFLGEQENTAQEWSQYIQRRSLDSRSARRRIRGSCPTRGGPVSEGRGGVYF